MRENTMNCRKRTNVLFLPNIQRGDIEIDDSIFDAKFEENAGTSAHVPVGNLLPKFKALPATYTAAAWPKSTNLHCWSCTLDFRSVPIFVPTTITADSDSVETMGVEGCFCDFACAQRFIDREYSGQMLDDKTRMLKILYRSMRGRPIEIIKAADPHTCMEMYCGTTGGIARRDMQQALAAINTAMAIPLTKMSALTC